MSSEQKNCNKGDTHKVHVMVYGTLKHGCGNHSLMKHINAKLIGRDSISGGFTMVSFGGFPAVCRDPVGAGTMYGEVYQIDPEHLSALDGLEGHPRWYRREKLTTDYNEIRAWIYLMPESEIAKKEVIDDGMWRIQPEERAWWYENHQVGFAA